ncbi:hypothetical protein JCM33374_g5303, partial [Metschnikowia sp. JCM 33374]
ISTKSQSQFGGVRTSPSRCGMEKTTEFGAPVSTSHSLSGGVRTGPSKGGKQFQEQPHNRSFESHQYQSQSSVVVNQSGGVRTSPSGWRGMEPKQQQDFGLSVSTSHSLSGGVRTSPSRCGEWNKNNGSWSSISTVTSQWWCKNQSK